MNNISIDDLIKRVSYYDDTNLNIIKRAYDYADYMHEGQLRQSGEAYITHPLNVAYILSEMHADIDSICAALLHDTIEDTRATKMEITNLFNREIAKLVDGVTKISKMNFSSKVEQNLANIRKIVVGIMEDVRIIIIKLADRLHNMRTLQYKSVFKQQENSIETMEIYVPLAYYLGAYRIKNELEDICLRYLKPDEYKKLEYEVEKRKEENEECLREMLITIDSMLTKEDIHHYIKYRTKNIYGIYKKVSDGYKISDIHDLLALKIMVEQIKECYLTLGYVHSKYHPMNYKFKDYIWNPKTNMYQSLHTTVFAKNDKLVQTQIRTFDMDKVASFGLPVYWDINRGDARNIMQEKIKNEFQVFKSLDSVNMLFEDNKDFVSQIKSELFKEKIYVYDSIGKRIEIPKNSNIIDLVCYLDIENVVEEVKVNDKLADWSLILNSKDRVSIKTNSLASVDKSYWSIMANTGYAKRKLSKVNNSKVKKIIK